MSDLISRKALLDDFRKTITEQSDTTDWLNMINRQPSQAQENQRCHICQDTSNDRYYKNQGYKYCPHCGASINRKAEEE